MKKIVIKFIQLYQYFLSPLLGNRCRFSPSCSEYMMTAVDQFGIFKGLWMGLKRLLKCGPWSSGGYDPVPPKHNHDL
jgi:uncharacterized protein